MSAKKLASVGAQNYCDCEMRKLVLHWRRLACRAQRFTDGAQVPPGLPLAPPLALMNCTAT